MLGRPVLVTLAGAGLLLAGRLAAQAAAPANRAPVRELSLEDALRLAGPSSEAVGIARAAVTRARGEQYRARSEYFPQVSGSASYTRTLKSQFSALNVARDSSAGSQPQCARFRPNPQLPIDQRVDSLENALDCLSGANPFAGFGDLPFGRKNEYRFGLALSQTLFAGGRVRAQNRTAQAGRRSAEIGVTTAEAQLTLEVTRAYYDAALSDRLLAIAAATLELADTTLAQTRLAREVGTQPEFELLRAQVTRDNQRPVVIQRRSERELAFLRLEQLVNLPLDQSLTLTTDLADTTLASAPTLATLISTPTDSAAETRAPVRQAGEAVRAQEGLLTAARAQRLPSLSLTSQFARIGYPNSGLPGWNDFLSDWTVGVGLQVPLFTGGRIRGDEMVARANLEEARLRLQQTRELAQLDSRHAYSTLEAAEAAWAASQGTVTQAVRAYQIADLRYREGISTQTELADSRILLQQAQANSAVAARDLQVARVRAALLANLPLGTETGGEATVQVQPQGAQPSPVRPSPPRQTPPAATVRQAGQTGNLVP